MPSFKAPAKESSIPNQCQPYEDSGSDEEEVLDLGHDSDTTLNLSSAEEEDYEDSFEGDLDQEDDGSSLGDPQEYPDEEVFEINNFNGHEYLSDESEEDSDTEDEDSSDEEDEKDVLRFSPTALSDGESFGSTDGLVYSKRRPGQVTADRIYIMYYSTEASKVGAVFKSGLKCEDLGLLGTGVYVTRQAENKTRKVWLKLLVHLGM